MGLLDNVAEIECCKEDLSPGAVLLRAFALPHEAMLLTALHTVIVQAPFRHMVTPGGFRMSVAMTNCGALGWITDRTGYRYDEIDPDSGRKWPSMPESFVKVATWAAEEAGFQQFKPDACLINRYGTGAKLSLHQDKNERDLSQPIVSVSLGIPAIFLFGGTTRSAKTARVPVVHGDVVVWGGAARLRYHGVTTLKEGFHPQVGAYRVNLTFRKAA